MASLTVILAVAISAAVAIDEKEINRINSAQSSWTAGENKITKMGSLYRKRLLGAQFSKDIEYKTDMKIANHIPEFFDARAEWPNCVSISSIKNQGYCGSCWAVAAVSCASDRLCINTNGGVQLNISAENLFTCCSKCVQRGHKGCDGGDSMKAWQYLRDIGVVTGGDYGSNEGCQPYQIAPTLNMYTPPCERRCTNKQYSTSYKDDKHFAKNAYFVSQDVAAIQTEILSNGPVEAGFIVYEDFFSYTTGVYIRTSNTQEGGHAVRILGWGVEGGVDYWLVANSWGRDWGEDGLFKIRRGTNECQFESYITAGLVSS